MEFLEYLCLLFLESLGKIQFSYNSFFSKPRKDPCKFKISKNHVLIWNFRIFSQESHVSFAFFIFHSLKSGKTPKNSKFLKILVIFGISAIFYPEIMYHLYVTFTRHLSSKKSERPRKILNSKKCLWHSDSTYFSSRNHPSYWSDSHNSRFYEEKLNFGH